MGIDQLVTGGDVDDPVVDSLTSDSVNTVEARFGATEEWRVVNSEAEFSTALSELGDGGLIMPTQSVEVTGDHSFSTNLTIIGPSAARGAFPEAWIDNGATLTANGRLAIANSSLGDCTIDINAPYSSIVGTNAQGSTQVNVSDKKFRCSALVDASISLESASDRCVIDSSSNVSVTDNGSNNVVGDIA